MNKDKWRRNIGLVLTLVFSLGHLGADESDHHLESFLSSKNPDYRLSVTHIHGAGFQNEDLVIATHLGFLRYRDGMWIAEESAPHDYMGFAMVENGAYVSGHPSILHTDEFRNPLGVMFTADWGSNLIPMAYYGDIDFHWLSAGYATSSVYALTSSDPINNSPLFAVSLDSGFTWESKQISGTRGALKDLVAHPIEPRTVFLLTDTGLYVSPESGGRFLKLASVNSVSTMGTDRTGEKLYLGGSEIQVFDLQGRLIEKPAIPGLAAGEVISEIAVGSKDARLMAFSTTLNNVYLSRDNGSRWEQILSGGNATGPSQQGDH